MRQGYDMRRRKERKNRKNFLLGYIGYGYKKITDKKFPNSNSCERGTIQNRGNWRRNRENGTYKFGTNPISYQSSDQTST